MQLTQCSLLLSAFCMFRAVFHPSSGAYKTVCAALGIVMLSCCLPLVWMGWNRKVRATVLHLHDQGFNMTWHLAWYVYIMWIERVVVYIRNPMIVAAFVCQMSADFKPLPEVSSQEVYTEHISLLSPVWTIISHVSHCCSGPADKVFPLSVQISLNVCTAVARCSEVPSSYMIDTIVFL